jgi:DNA-directed RNA polymerase specialized sigma24 family protein
VREAIRLEQRRQGMLARWFGRPPETIVDPLIPHDPDFAMRTAMNDLPVEQRAAIVLHHYAGFSVEETAELLGVPFETLRSRLKAARRRLRISLGGSPIGS